MSEESQCRRRPTREVLVRVTLGTFGECASCSPECAAPAAAGATTTLVVGGTITAGVVADGTTMIATGADKEAGVAGMIIGGIRVAGILFFPQPVHLLTPHFRIELGKTGNFHTIITMEERGSESPISATHEHCINELPVACHFSLKSSFLNQADIPKKPPPQPVNVFGIYQTAVSWKRWPEDGWTMIFLSRRNGARLKTYIDVGQLPQSQKSAMQFQILTAIAFVFSKFCNF
ncbi:hypothetical protein B0H13DRAFT_1914104 [Mycena leptocephala]|nr:hypothetical protein B0H13DRAFT_1914104 [Mycena leptocephala]